MSVTAALSFAFREFWSQRIFWIGIAALCVLLGSIRVEFKNDWIIWIIICLVEFYINIGISQIALKSLSNQQYEISDLMVEPNIFLKCLVVYGVVFLIGFLALIPIMLVAFYIHSNMLYMIFSTAIAMLIPVFFLFKLIFSPFHIIEGELTLVESIKASWKECNTNVCLNLVLCCVMALIVNLPMWVLYFLLKPYHVHILYMSQPIILLSLVNMYVQLGQTNKIQTENLNEQI